AAASVTKFESAWRPWTYGRPPRAAIRYSTPPTSRPPPRAMRNTSSTTSVGASMASIVSARFADASTTQLSAQPLVGTRAQPLVVTREPDSLLAAEPFVARLSFSPSGVWQMSAGQRLKSRDDSLWILIAYRYSPSRNSTR